MMDKKESFGWGDNILFELSKKERKNQHSWRFEHSGIGGGIVNKNVNGVNKASNMIRGFYGFSNISKTS